MHALLELCWMVRSARRQPHFMQFQKKNGLRPSFRSRCQLWKSEMALRYCWFRILLHLQGMVRCPRHISWHGRHIRREFYDLIFRH